MRKVNVYIDGFNLYHAIAAIDDQSLKWINYRDLSASFLRRGEELNRVVFFTAVLTWEHQKQKRHKTFISAQKANGVEVVESNFRKMKKHCREMDRYCSRHEEKQTDVAFALTVFRDAMIDSFDRAVLVTADSDQVPMVKMVRESFPRKRLTLAAPPGRGGEARELGSIVHDRTPIEPGRLRGCKLPRDVKDGNGRTVATRPAIYEA